jgi:long-chain acyl-CoA synthetase
MNWKEAEKTFDDPLIGVSTIPVMFEESVERNRHRPAQQYKGGVYDRSLAETVLPAALDGEYRSLTYDTLQSVVRRLAAGFRSLGVEGGDRVGIFSSTRMEWAQTDFAVLAAGGVVTTVYKSSSESQVQYLLDDPGACGVILENAKLLERVLAVEDDLELDFIVSMD